MTVVRFRNKRLLDDPGAVLAEIAAAARHPLPVGEGRLRNRRGETLFIDARKLGTLIDRVHRELTDADLNKIVNTYHLWRGDARPASGHPRPVGEGRGEGVPQQYQDIPGFCKAATTAEIAAHSYVLTPGRYVGAEEIEDDGEPFEEKITRLVSELNGQFAESAKLEKAIKANLRGLGYGG
jgi:type I restriction enzyme M protein